MELDMSKEKRKFFDIEESFERQLRWDRGSEEAWDNYECEPKSFALARHFMTTEYYTNADYYDTLGGYYGAVGHYLYDMAGYQEGEVA